MRLSVCVLDVERVAFRKKCHFWIPIDRVVLFPVHATIRILVWPQPSRRSKIRFLQELVSKWGLWRPFAYVYACVCACALTCARVCACARARCFLVSWCNLLQSLFVYNLYGLDNFCCHCCAAVAAAAAVVIESGTQRHICNPYDRHTSSQRLR